MLPTAAEDTAASTGLLLLLLTAGALGAVAFSGFIGMPSFSANLSATVVGLRLVLLLLLAPLLLLVPSLRGAGLDEELPGRLLQVLIKVVSVGVCCS